MMDRLQGRTALVTGGASGIGRATCIALADEGAAIVVADIARDAANAVVDEVIARGGTAVAAAVDVSDSASCDAAVALAAKETGRLDVLFHAAGLHVHNREVADTSDELWHRLIQTNLTGTFYVCRAAIPHLREAGGGTIALMASGRVVLGTAKQTAYAASKGGVASFTRSLAWEVGPDGINVNSIIPGFVAKEGSLGFMRDQGIDVEETIAGLRSTDPLRGISSPEDVASFVVYLATAGRWITGGMHTLRVQTS
jgi:NAD(P)-dependent dehydrogenase (short-subunit alcohol dehydrogenase family)